MVLFLAVVVGGFVERGPAVHVAWSAELVGQCPRAGGGYQLRVAYGAVVGLVGAGQVRRGAGEALQG